MNKKAAIIIFTALLLFCGLTAGAIAWTVPAIEQELTGSASKALAEQGLTFARVEADGRDLIITGDAPGQDAAEEARRIVASTRGHRVVWDRMTVAPSPPAEPTSAPIVIPPEVQRAVSCQNSVDQLLSESQFEFEFGRTRLSTASASLLSDVANILKTCPEAAFEIEGHTDNQGPDHVNLRVSKYRARSVMRALKRRGVDESRMRAVGYGASRPIGDNSIRTERAKNRRIELRIMRKD
ncbi:MAG: OmpA family protein [Myxococcota bacterium]